MYNWDHIKFRDYVDIEIQRRVESVMREIRDSHILLEHVRDLFGYIEDSDDEKLVRACAYFVKEHGFDIKVLPVEMRERVRISKIPWL